MPKQLKSISAEDEYIEKYEIQENEKLIKALIEALNKLSKKQRRRIKMKYFDNLTFGEISEIEYTYKSAIQSNISQSIKSLKKILEEFKV